MSGQKASNFKPTDILESLIETFTDTLDEDYQEIYSMSLLILGQLNTLKENYFPHEENFIEYERVPRGEKHPLERYALFYALTFGIFNEKSSDHQFVANDVLSREKIADRNLQVVVNDHKKPYDVIFASSLLTMQYSGFGDILEAARSLHTQFPPTEKYKRVESS